MKLIVGLGNPGKKYEGNRHNIGFMVVDAIHARHGFSQWRKRFRGQTADGSISGERVLLLKPETFMNESGRAIGEAAKFLKIKPSDIIVLHDELDLAPGKLRTKVGGGHAGHNGLRSTEQQIGKEFVRIRLGIGHPGHKDRVAGYVLHDFAKADRDWLDRMTDAIAAEAAGLASGDLERFQTAVSQAMSDGRTSERTKVAGTGSTPKRTKGGAPSSPRSKANDTAARRPSQRELAARSARPAPKRSSGNKQSGAAQPAKAAEKAAPRETEDETQAKTLLGDKLNALAKLFGRNTKS